MAKKKKALLPKLEILIILVFFFSFIAWAVTRCNATKQSYQEEETLEEPVANETDATNDSKQKDEAENTSAPIPATTTENPVNPSNSQPEIKPQYSTLYVTIEDLNMRTGPSLDSAVILKLPLFEEVAFMNEVTDFKLTLNLGKEIANEPWVKVKSKKGHIGWVYGAGVHYYKVKRSGVLE